MPDGESSSTADFHTGVGREPCGPASVVVEPSTSHSDQVELVSRDKKAEKDPRKIARKYQLELCQKALEENVIVYLETGCGKTHIAVLLIYEMGHLICKPQKNICVFLAPTVALVQQQARVIEDSIDFKVGIYCGSSKRLKSQREWDKELEQYEVLVMTPQILFHNLSHCLIKMEFIALLIFDECHHAQVKSNHPYAEIMKIFYKSNAAKLPRIFGMTASPVVGKGATNQANLHKSINSLECLLDAKVYSVEDKEELNRFVATPEIKVHDFDSTISGTTINYATYYGKLEEIKHQCIATLYTKTEDHQNRRNIKKVLSRMHDNVVFCLEKLGVWGALQATRILLSGDYSERNELVEAAGDSTDDSVCDTYLAQAAAFFASSCTRGCNLLDPSSVEVLKEPFFSRKLLCLIGILSSFGVQPNMKCIVFVNRIVTARSLSFILHELKFLASWKSNFLVGVHSGLKSMSRKTMSLVLEKFHSGELNLLVATKVGEEGLDIQTCCLVIRFDLPETVASFIQSRGRARMPQSKYVFLVDSGNKKDLDLIENFKRDENRINLEIAKRTSNETFISPEERVYRVDSSGASVTSGYSVSLLHKYCSKLVHDEFFDPKPNFFYFDDLGGTVCHITLPSNAPILQIVGTPECSMEAAKKDACLKAIEELHKIGALNDYLLPEQGDANAEELITESSDSVSCEDDSSRGELHEMHVSTALRKPWTNRGNHVHLNSYYIQFSPDPEDRTYKTFGLYVETCLPTEAERMEVDLHLAHSRSVMTRLVSLGVAEFNKDEIKMAEDVQEMYLKIILDRSEFVPEFVPLGKNDFRRSNTSTSYLLLPVILHEYDNTMTVDWKIVRRCLSSPIFRHPADTAEQEIFSSDDCLQLANGCKSIRVVQNSLVYAAYKNTFYFVTDIVREKKGLTHEDSGTSSYVDLIKRFDIHLKYPEQPLLHAKPLFSLRNLLHNRKQEDSEAQELEEYFVELPPELCHLKIIGFSKDIGSSLSLLPSIMHRLENLLVAIELKQNLSHSFPEGSEITAHRVLEALTTEKCQERFSLERLEILGDAFLKFAVGRHVFLMHNSLDEGGLTRMRSSVVNNSNLFRLATKHNLQVYIRDQAFDPSQFFALGRPCPRVCTKEIEERIHLQHLNSASNHATESELRCSKNHHWLYKKTIADVVEALVGAFIVDSGFKAATAFLRWIGVQVDFEASEVINVCTSSTRYIPLSASVDISSLEGKLGYQFHYKGLLLQAFVHPSYSKHGGGCYQRLEFLGDAVLDYLITSYLYSVYPKLKPGQLTDLRSVYVNNKAFANVAVDRSFHKFLLCDSSGLSEAVNQYVDYMRTPLVGKGVFEEPKCPKALGDLVESCVGAILLDSGFNLNCVWKIMMSFLGPIMTFSCLKISPIRELKELCQYLNLELQFFTSKKAGIFSVEARVNGKDVCATASASSPNKKESVRIASQLIFAKLKAHGCKLKSKSLEEVLKYSTKMEAKLIGYNESPIDVNATSADSIEKSMVKKPTCSNSSTEIHSTDEADNIYSPNKTPLSRKLQSSFGAVKKDPCKTIENSDSDTNSQRTGGSYKGAKSRLHEICVANCWESPSFDCCKEEGPDHSKIFTCKVTVVIKEEAESILECYGEPRLKKKDAAENAAEGALWYLQQTDYLLKK
ncbi:Dicer-like protein [Quillaja saponaria]|uniref:Dicer-like protein n=1 Tax=Quillaja saponaria TaxID=32244 RepID=A0AAD7QDR7_QUISA|nr:Dicer-like protein [Quillaja saponaria]